MNTLIGVLIGSVMAVVIFNITGLNALQPVQIVQQPSETIPTGVANNTSVINPQQTISATSLQGSQLNGN